MKGTGALLALGVGLAGGAVALADPADVPATPLTVVARALFADPREPPPYQALDAAERADYELGQAVFNTQWVPAGTARAARRDGLGPVFNAASCDACHNNGARLRSPLAAGPAPVGMVVRLRRPDGLPSAYGAVLNPAAIDGHAAEGVVDLRFTERRGRYPDGAPWTLRVPAYAVRPADARGTLPLDIVVGPRIPPAIFGAGLLDAVPESALRAGSEDGRRTAGRFGWQADAVSLAQQTANAFSREMGLSTALVPHDDCAPALPAHAACRDAATGGSPEVSAELMAAVLSFQRGLAVPAAPSAPVAGEGEGDGSDAATGRRLFVRSGCAGCHRPILPVDTAHGPASIDPYTDLRLHDLGPGLADRNLAGRTVPSHWRTAPLWGLGYALAAGRGRAQGGEAALLHDGRARSVEEAILWHGGEATDARTRFGRLAAAERRTLLDWVARR